MNRLVALGAASAAALVGAARTVDPAPADLAVTLAAPATAEAGEIVPPTVAGWETWARPAPTPPRDPSLRRPPPPPPPTGPPPAGGRGAAPRGPRAPPPPPP